MSIEDVRNRIPVEWGQWIQVGEGWHDIVTDLDDQLSAIDPDYRVHQVKEKFGTLRFYFGTDKTGEWWEEMHRLANEAAEESRKTCEVCGKEGRERTESYWIKTLCDECAEVDLVGDP